MPLKNEEERRAWNKEWRTRNADTLREKRRARRNTEHGKLVRKLENQRYRTNNLHKVLERGKTYRENNREFCRESVRRSYAKHWLKTRQKRNAYERANKDRIRERNKLRRQTDPQYRIRINVRRKIAMALERFGTVKSHRTSELTGCSFEFLKNHLENQFQPGMTWANHGRSGWHIDHKKPCCSFNLLDPLEQRKCFHFSNLQPLWAIDNLRKGVKCES